MSEAQGIMPPSTDLLQGTLDLLILKTLALEPMHGWGVAQRIQQISKEVCRSAKDLFIRRCIDWNTKDGFSRIGEVPKTIDGQSSIR